MKIIYEAFFIDEPEVLEELFPAVHLNKFYHHSTIAFKPESLSEPERLGEEVELKIIGRLTTDEIDALVVEPPFLMDRGFPHITLSTGLGVPPSRAKTAFRDRAGYLIKFFGSPQYVKATYGYFNGENVITKREELIYQSA